MNVQKYYFASFSVGNVEVWQTDFYLEKESVFEDIEDTIEDIVDQIKCFDLFHSEEELKHAISELQTNEFYKEDNLDFFILGENIWNNYKQKKEIQDVTN
jgi:Rad3-related DNA helicase